MKGKIRYFRLIFVKTLPLWLISLLLAFFTFYQMMIGNVFLEDIHPGVILIVFSLGVLVFSIFSSVFSVRVGNSSFRVRLGYFKLEVDFRSIKSMSFQKFYKNEDITYGVSFGKLGEIFIKIDNVMPLEIVTEDGKKVLIFEKNIVGLFETIKEFGVKVLI